MIEGVSEAPGELVEQLDRTIWHEAAHTVVALAVGARVKFVDVWITEGGHPRGSMQNDPTPHNPVIAVAGAVGETLRFGNEAQLSEADRKFLAGLAIAEQDAAVYKAVEILRANWGGWHGLAEVLKDRPTLRGDEIVFKGVMFN